MPAHEPLQVPTSGMDALTLRELQHRVDAWIAGYEEGYFPALASLARLSEEVGELARALSHEDGFKRPKPGEAPGSIAEELGDIVFVLVCLANPRGIDLDEVMRRVLEKVARRDGDRWTRRPSLPAAAGPAAGDASEDLAAGGDRGAAAGDENTDGA